MELNDYGHKKQWTGIELKKSLKIRLD